MASADSSERLTAALVPVTAWVVAVCLLAVVGVESTTRALPPEVAAHERVVAYLSLFATAGITAAMGVLFALATGVMLWWVERPVPPKRIVLAVADAYWVLALYSAAVAVLILQNPAPAPTLSELLDAADLTPLMLGVEWGWVSARALGGAALCVGCCVVWWRLSYVAGRALALLGVGAGVSVVAFVMAVLSRLASRHLL